MDHYLDIQIRPDPEFPGNMLMGALVSKLHRQLVILDANDIGISLPEHGAQSPLGRILRIHARRKRLEALMATDWMKGMRDHVSLTDLLPVPDHAEYRIVRRRQFKTSVERLRRRRMKRHGESYEKACANIPESVERRVDTPYVVVRSQSTGQTFSLFLEHGMPTSEATEGEFSKYGLSDTATVPWF